MTNRKKTVTRFGVLTVIILLASIFIYLLINPILDINKQFEFIKNEYNSNPIFSNNRIKPIIGGWKTIKSQSINQTLVLTKFDIFNPIYTIVIDNPATEYYGNKAYQNVRVIYLRRTGINTFDIKDFRNNEISNLSLPEALSIVSKYDINTDFPGKEKYHIINYPALSQSEIEKNKQKIEDQSQIDQSNEEYEKYIQTTYSSLLTQYFEILELVKTDNLTPQQIEINKQSASTKIKALQTELQQIQNQLNNNQNYTLPNNVTINPAQRTKDYIQQFIDEIAKIKGDNGIE